VVQRRRRRAAPTEWATSVGRGKAAIHGSDRISLASEAALHDFRQFGAVSGAFSAFFHRLTKKSD